MDIGDILKILPHRYPFLLIDRVVGLVRKESIVALKNVTITEPFFRDTSRQPIMPGVLIVEAIAQAGGLLLLTEVPNRDEMLMVFTESKKPLPPPRRSRRSAKNRSRSQSLAHDRRPSRRQSLRGRKVACEAIVTCARAPSPGAGKAEAASDQSKKNL